VCTSQRTFTAWAGIPFSLVSCTHFSSVLLLAKDKKERKREEERGEQREREPAKRQPNCDQLQGKGV